MKQINTYNVGITEPIPGYSYQDGVHFGMAQHDSYRPLAHSLIETFHPKRVLELGSGSGSLARHLRERDPELLVVTLDGNQDTAKSPFIDPSLHFVCRTDQPVYLEEDGRTSKFDLIVSFEHFEHISSDAFDIFLENMYRHAAAEATLVATASNWAYPDGSNIHCNVKNEAQWRSLLESLGFVRLPISLLCPANKPFNFELHLTTELIYRFPKTLENDPVKI